MIMKKNVRCLTGVFMAVVMLCVLGGCSGNDNNGDTDQTVSEDRNKESVAEDILDKAEEAALSEENIGTGKAMSGEDLDVATLSAADDDWYMNEDVYTDDKGNRLEVSFNDYGMLKFAVNGLSLYFTTVDSFQQENNWKVYTCDDGTMIIYYPGEPAHLEISDGDYAGLYEATAFLKEP